MAPKAKINGFTGKTEIRALQLVSIAAQDVLVLQLCLQLRQYLTMSSESAVATLNVQQPLLTTRRCLLRRQYRCE